MPRMTVEEARAFNEYFVNNVITLGPDGSGWLSQREMRSWGLENQTINYIIKKAMEEHKPPAQIINELVSKELAVAV